ncbi:methionyl-tRNA formyltransferase [Aeoliella sp.]|uniref:methionyl-tRNA formyltransferase n=1 Tax=Aeoliella sp. TaxID=2795800 RepID=UPI003CCB8DA3
MPNAPRLVFAGSVNTSRTALESIIDAGGNLVGVLELAPSSAKNVSGFAQLHDIAARANVPVVRFEKINAPEVVAAMEAWQPDLIFVVGLSQLVADELLALPRLGCVGFHPTLLPEGRGRAPIAWLALGQGRGAATFFLMDAGADSGPILAQHPFEVAPNDYAFDIEEKVNQSIRAALAEWLPRLNAGEWDPRPQDHSAASYLGKRTPADGHIDWLRPASEIAQLVRAASRPFPGAYTYLGDAKLIAWQASVVENPNILGVPGRVLEFDGNYPLVQTGEGVLRIDKMELQCDAPEPPKLRIGSRLGYSAEDEVHRLRKKVAHLESQIAEICELVHRRNDG